MMKIKPLITSMSIAVISAGMSLNALAATNNDTRTMPVRTADKLPDIAVLASLDVQESRSTSIDKNNSVATPNIQPQTTDSMGDLIDTKQKNKAQSTSEPVAADNMSAAELTRKDEQSDRTDDISEGQAVAAPSDISSMDATDPSTFEMPQYEKSLDFNNDPAIKNIEDKDGKRYTTLNLSNYAKQVNNATWSPNMKVNSAMTIKMQALLDWNHASPGPIDGGWGMNSKKALINFQTMKGLPATGTMDQKTWDALTKNIPANKPVLVTYTLTDDDIKTNFLTTPSGSEAKSKVKGLYYQDIKEMLAERFHMDIRYLDKLNKNKNYQAGETITVLNTRKPLNERINRVVADKASKTLYAYNGDKLVATYPTTIGSAATPSPQGTFKIINRVKMPWYKATVGEGSDKKVHMLPPGPNNPVGVVWMGLSKPSYGIHGSPKPEGISRQASAGCVRLTNWDVLEVYANIENGATVELK
ncbi:MULTISPECIES: L,D-transpeptidase family protein [unclassified Psychrobacter]|uniref:L,D-transpeptidase family protein n=1 Tax=unclassified Psychrobacter TaxID=196806 RepID=UPI000B144AE8|nr:MULTISPECIES: L,D-transpeptidase family protein [unclassified Psychrobacter]